MSICRWMDKEVMVHIHNGILLSYKKEHIWVCSNKVDETGAYYTEWSKSERETQIPYIKKIYMEFRKMVMMILHVVQQKRHRCKKQTFGLCGRRQGWDDLKEQHWNMFITICKIDAQCKFNPWSRAPKASALGQPRGMGWERRTDRGVIRMGGHMRTRGWLVLMYGKKHHNIVK